MSLRVAAKLCELGLRAEAATSIAYAIRDEWAGVIAASGPTFLLVEPTGGPVPYQFALLSSGQLATRCRVPSAIVLDVSAVARFVLEAALAHKPEGAHEH
jgi:hypothetical protein